MKIFAYKLDGVRRLGIEREGKGYDLTGPLEKAARPTEVIPLLEQNFFTRESMDSFLDQAGSLEPLPETVERDVPVARPSKIIAIAKNFTAHAREFGAEPPPEPVFFAKLPNTLVPSGQPLQIPYWLASRVDHEAEVAAIIGKKAHRVAIENALDHVAGFTIINDVTARHLQGENRKQGFPWLSSKSLDHAAPCGPCWIPADYAGDTDSWEIVCRVNGEERQRGRLGDMVHPVARLVSHVSQFITLEAGDLIALGTPSGVGPFEPGDTVECEVQPIGILSNPVAREKTPESLTMPLDKATLFDRLGKKLEVAIQTAGGWEPSLQRTVDLLHASLPHYHWTGMYLLDGDHLNLGPYHGKPTDHTRIPVGKGICGRAVAENQSIVVDDVTQEENYLACSLETRSEIVVPIYAGETIVGEIDIDSDIPGIFDDTDRIFLEKVAGWLGSQAPTP